MKAPPQEVKDEFKTRNHGTIAKLLNKYSAIPIDQAHEQDNKVMKAYGGAVGLTENPDAFRCWMMAGPELARLLKMDIFMTMIRKTPLTLNTMTRDLVHREASSERLTA